MTFLGFSITCARCHNHPLEKWTQKTTTRWRTSSRGSASRTAPIAATSSCIRPAPGTSTIRGCNVPLAAAAARRSGRWRSTRPATAARRSPNWLTAPDNPFFARSLVNRVWKNFMGRGPRRGGGRHPGYQPGLERGAVRGGDARLRRAPIRRQASGADDHDVDDLPAHLDADRSQRRRPEVPLALHRAPAPGGGDPRRHQPGDGRGRELSGLPGSPRPAAAGRRGRLLLSVRLWTPSASDGRRFGAPAGTEHHAGAARHQRRHHQPQAERVARSDSGSGDRERGKRGRARTDLPGGAQPVSLG